MSEEDREPRLSTASPGDMSFPTLLDACDFGLVVVNSDRMVTIWNEWVARFTGKTSNEVVGRRLEDVFPSLRETRVPGAIETALQSGMPSVLSPRLNKRPFPLRQKETGIKAGKGEADGIDQSITVKPINRNGGSPSCLIQIVDVTSIMTREKLLRKMTHDTKRQRDELVVTNQDKDRFFSIIAHDLKGPFNALLGLSKILSTDSEKIGPQKVASYSAALHFSAKELFKLLENLLDWSLIQMGRMEYRPTKLTPTILIHDCINLMAPTAVSKGIRLDIQDDGCGRIHADGRMTATILRNIVGNAVKFTPSAGKVEISCREVDGMAVISVADTGEGLSEERIDRLLNTENLDTREGTAGETGSGLGIHLCKELIRIQGGTLSIDSKPGEGAKFSFTLPLAAD